MTFFDRDGRRIGYWRYAELVSDLSYVDVGCTAIGDDAEVSTVWLGMNHNWRGSPPLIFETMVFGGSLDGHQWRYATEQEAREGHDTVVALARQTTAS